MKIRFHGVGIAPMEQLARNVEYCKSLGLPEVGQSQRTRLAVVGGGPSVKEHIEELRDFDGDIWAASGCHRWLKGLGIDSWFFAIGPEKVIAEMCDGADKAVLASCVDPSVFDKMKGNPVRVLDLVHDGDMINHGPSTVTAGFVFPIYAGYREVTFYGCDSSYPRGESSHAYENCEHDFRLLIKANGEMFHTDALLFLQAEYMATMIRRVPSVYKEKSGGLLRAMIADMDYDITGITPALKNFMEKQAA